MAATATATKAAATILLVLLLFLHQIDGEQENKTSSRCDIFRGKWVYDASYPLYNANSCPFIEQEFNCRKNGRPDSLYLKYRWKPTSCNLPRFDGRDFLKRYRGKRIMFVGDSLSLNQWQSLTCMLYLAEPNTIYKSSRNTKGLSTFTFPAHNVSVLFSRNAYLVDIVKEKAGRVLKLNSIESGEMWKGVDTLIFDTWHWWLHTGRKQGWDMIQDSNGTYKDMDRLVAYGKALKTWANWVNSNVDSSKTKVFFQGISPDHANSTEWGDPTAKTCRGETKPLLGHDKYPGGPLPAQATVEKVLRTISKKVYLLDITALSQVRKDGHPSAYGFGGRRGTDCTHWCLPGVPDTWNQLLYASLISTQR